MTSTDLVARPYALPNADDLHHLGSLVASSAYFSDAREAAQAAVKIMAGAELGIGPIASMRGVDIIKGEVTLAAGMVAALVRRSGVYDYDVTRWDNEACEIVFIRNGKALHPPSTFTLQDAHTAGLDRPNRDGSPSNYQKFARNMLFARAMTNGARIHCPDIFIGAVYTPEELGKGEVVEPGPVAPTPPPAQVSAPVSSAPEAEEMSAPGARTVAADESPTVEEPSPPEAGNGASSPAQIAKAAGIPEATQGFILVGVGVQDIGDLDAAYASLDAEQSEKVMAELSKRARS